MTIDDVVRAKSAIRGYARRTPLVRAERLEELFGGAEIYLKLENLQLTGSFKVRGVANKMLSLSPDELAMGVTAASSGNHAQAVAYMSRLLGVKAAIVMPENAPKSKVDGARGYGAEVIQYGYTGGDRDLKCDELIRTRGLCLVHSHADPLVIAGHGTAATEAVEQIAESGTLSNCASGVPQYGESGTLSNCASGVPQYGESGSLSFDEIVLPCGAGSLTAGAAFAIKALWPSIRATAVEPAAVPRFTESIKAGKPVTVEMGSTIADGLRVSKAEPINFELIRDNVDSLVTADEDSIARAAREVLLRAKILAEPSACVGVAAALAGKIDMRAGRRVCFIISGGNADPRLLAGIISGDAV